MTTLHTVNKSPYERNSLERCMQYALPGSAILLIEDAVYAANDRSEFSARLNALNDVRVFALEPDMRARGVSERDGISLVDYAGFVELAVTYDKVQSWL